MTPISGDLFKGMVASLPFDMGLMAAKMCSKSRGHLALGNCLRSLRPGDPCVLSLRGSKEKKEHLKCLKCLSPAPLQTLRSAKIASAKLMPDEPAHVLWKAKRPLIRRMRVSANEWILLAVNLWESEDASSTVEVPLEKGNITLEVRGRHSEIFHCVGESIRRM